MACLFRPSVALAVVVPFLLGTPASVRAEDWPVARGPAHELVPYRYDAGQWKSVPKEFLEDAAACTLYSGVTNLVEADGTVETISHEVTRFNGRKGIDKLGEYRNIAYDPAYEKLTLNEARVLKADGRVVPIEPKHVQVRDLSTDYQVYESGKQVVISFPNLEVGDAIEVMWTTRGKNPEYQGQFFTRYNFGDDHYPVVTDELRVRLPKGRALKYAAVGGKLDPDIREDGDWRTYHWRATNRRAFPQDENLPSKEELRLEVACSTFTSWDQVGQWKRTLRAPCWKCTPEVRQVVAEITRDLHTPLEKARALTYWLRRHIRYVSVGEKHDFTPHLPGQVLANRFGDCKDQSQLLAVMLREAGIPVALATLGALDDGQILEQVPSPWGTHAILLATIDGKEHWIDTTASMSGWDQLPRDDRDRLTYLVDDKGLRLVRTPSMSPEDNRVEQTTRVSVGADGSSHNERTSTYQGAAAVAQREEWLEVPPGERRRVKAADLQNAQATARLRRLAVDEQSLREFDRPVGARVEFDVPGQFTGEGSLEGSVTDSKVWNKLLSVNLDYDRQVPLDLGDPFESFHHYVIQLPPALRFDGAPKDKEYRSAWGSFVCKVQSDPKKPRELVLDFHTRVEKARVDPGDFEKFRKFQEQVFKNYRVWLTLKPTDDLADAPALEKVVAQTPGDSASARILARLYYDNDQPTPSHRVVQEALRHNPGDAALLELSVKVAANAREQESAYQELVRKFPEESRYRIALGETRFKQGDFDGARKALEPIARKGAQEARGLAHYQLACCSLAQDRPAEALKHFDAALKFNPDAVATAASWQLKGRIEEKLAQPDEAAAAYREALKVDPKSQPALEALIRLNLDAGKRSDALDYLRRYTVLAAGDPGDLVAAAELHLRMGRFEDAFDLATRSQGQKPSPEAEKVLGLVAVHRGDNTQAAAHLEKAGADGQALTALIQAYVALGRLGDAEKTAAQSETIKQPSADLTKARTLVQTLVRRRAAVRNEVRAPKSNTEAYGRAIDCFVCGEHAFETGKPAGDVEALLARAVTAEVDLGPAYGLRSVLALGTGRLGRALADAEKAVSMSPRDARGYYVRGRVRLERATPGALEDLARAVELTGRKDGVMLHWLAAAEFAAGRHEQALADQRQAAGLRPGDIEIAEQYRRFEQAAGKRTAGQ